MALVISSVVGGFLLQIAAVQFLLLQREALADHDCATPRQVFEELRQQRVPRATVLLQREVQLEGGHRPRIAFNHADPLANLIILEVDEQRAPPQSAGLVLRHPQNVTGHTGQQVSWQ